MPYCRIRKCLEACLARLSTKPCQGRTRPRDVSLELGIGVLPEVHKARVVFAGFGAVTARVIQLTEPPQGGAQRGSVIKDAGHAERRYDALVEDDRRVCFVGSVVSAGDLEKEAAVAALRRLRPQIGRAHV